MNMLGVSDGLRISLVTNLSLLGVFKYLGFIIESWNTSRFVSRLTGRGSSWTCVTVGISFYTFQTMSYTIDIYRKKQKPYDSFLELIPVMLRSSRNWWPAILFALTTFVNNWHQYLMAPSAYRNRFGMTLIIYGIAKKLVIADNVAVHANEVFLRKTGALNHRFDLVGITTVLRDPNLL